MSHAIYKVTGFEIIGPHMLRINFNDGSAQAINFRPVLAGELYAPLNDIEVFNKVRLDPEVHTLVWPNGADFDPATLHDWPSYREAFARRAREWASERPKRDRVSRRGPRDLPA